jgi:uncharacterized SAM-binding protein YcdF (DUF218 family)
MNSMLSSTIAALMLPPLNLIMLASIGALLLRRHRTWGKCLIATSIMLLWILSMPAMGNFLLSCLERGANTPILEMSKARAIVILAGGRNYDIAEFGGDTADKFTLERVRLGALVQRKTGLPILVTGGKPDQDESSEAELMQRALEEFSVTAKWIEPEAKNTAQNAAFSADILAKQKINVIVLVTHGWHMPRARAAFERAGLQVLPSGVGRHRQDKYTVLQFLPSAEGLARSEMFMHEVIGMTWYWATQAGASQP